MTDKAEGFACRCGPKGRRRMIALQEWALKYLKCTRRSLASRILIELHGAYWASIDDIGTDQWFGISASTYPNLGKGSQFHTYIQADDVVDGLALTLRTFYKHFGERREIGEDDDDEDDNHR